MGQDNSGLQRIRQFTGSSSTLKQSPGERAFLSQPAREEYVHMTRLFIDDARQYARILTKRKAVRGQFIAELIEFGRESQGYCSEYEFLHLLFRRPVKSLLQQMSNRRAADEWFDEGEAMMIAYCALEGLKLYRSMREEYAVTVEEGTLFVSNSGMIVLSDTERFRKEIGGRGTSRVAEAEVTALRQLGAVLANLQNGARGKYSEGLRGFIEALIRGEMTVYEAAIQVLYRLKKQYKTANQREATLSLISYSGIPLKCEEPSTLVSGSTPIAKLANLSQKREPLRQLTVYSQNRPMQTSAKQAFQQRQHQQPNFNRRENRCISYKSQFQAKVSEVTPQETRLYEQGVTLHLDELSSIVERGMSRESEVDDHIDSSTQFLHELQRPGVFLPMIDLFSPSRPQRLKQLVLNQKGIIYQESGDELQSLASQRTFRPRTLLTE